jgi:hypothetical protein
MLLVAVIVIANLEGSYTEVILLPYSGDENKNNE